MKFQVIIWIASSCFVHTRCIIWSRLDAYAKVWVAKYWWIIIAFRALSIPWTHNFDLIPYNLISGVNYLSLFKNAHKTDCVKTSLGCYVMVCTYPLIACGFRLNKTYWYLILPPFCENQFIGRSYKRSLIRTA